MTVELHADSSIDLTPQEQILLQRFDSWLGRPIYNQHGTLPPWEVYPKPHLNGLYPSFLLLNPQVGIALFEVAESCEPNADHPSEHPIDKMARIRDDLFNLYCPVLATAAIQDPQAWAIISSNIVVTNLDRQSIAAYIQAWDQNRRRRNFFINRDEVPDEFRRRLGGLDFLKVSQGRQFS